jgi:hypothetical protein
MFYTDMHLFITYLPNKAITANDCLFCPQAIWDKPDY